MENFKSRKWRDLTMKQKWDVVSTVLWVIAGFIIVMNFVGMFIYASCHAVTPVKQAQYSPEWGSTTVFNDDNTCYITGQLSDISCTVVSGDVTQESGALQLSFSPCFPENSVVCTMNTQVEFLEPYQAPPSCENDGPQYCTTQEDCENNSYYWMSWGVCSATSEPTCETDAYLCFDEQSCIENNWNWWQSIGMCMIDPEDPLQNDDVVQILNNIDQKMQVSIDNQNNILISMLEIKEKQDLTNSYLYGVFVAIGFVLSASIFFLICYFVWKVIIAPVRDLM